MQLAGAGVLLDELAWCLFTTKFALKVRRLVTT